MFILVMKSKPCGLSKKGGDRKASPMRTEILVLKVIWGFKKIISNVEEESFSPYSLTNERDGFTLRNAKNSIIHSVSVYSADGKLYHETSVLGNEFRIMGLPSGVYHVYIKTNYGIAIEKVLSVQ